MVPVSLCLAFHPRATKRQPFPPIMCDWYCPLSVISLLRIGVKTGFGIRGKKHADFRKKKGWWLLGEKSVLASKASGRN